MVLSAIYITRNRRLIVTWAYKVSGGNVWEYVLVWSSNHRVSPEQEARLRYERTGRLATGHLVHVHCNNGGQWKTVLDAVSSMKDCAQ